MAPLAPTKIWTKKKKTKKQNVDNYLKVTPLAPTKIRTQKEKIKKQKVELESSSAEDEDQDEDEGGHLHGFSTDDDDSSEEEDAMDDGPSAFDVSKLPTIAKDDAIVKHKLDKVKRQPVRLLLLLIKYMSCWSYLQTEDRGVLFIGRLPHGFYEDQLKAYFSQFGNVTRLRVSRNKKV